MDKKYIDAEILENMVTDLPIPEQGYSEYDFVRLIEEAPAADVKEERHGKWQEVVEKNVTDGAGNPVSHIECSECGQYWGVVADKHILAYCPGCGAKMDR